MDNIPNYCLVQYWRNTGNSLGFSLNTEEQVIGLGHFITSEFLWFDLFYLFGTLIFYYSWRRYDPIFGKIGQF